MDSPPMIITKIGGGVQYLSVRGLYLYTMSEDYRL